MPDPRTAVVNRALFEFGNEPVADLSDASLAGSVAAVKVLRILGEARDEVLERHGWVCALEYATLSPAVIAGYVAPPGYPWVYILPAGAIRVWEVRGGAGWNDTQQAWELRWQEGSTEADGSDRRILRVGPPVLAESLDGIGWGGPGGYLYGEGWTQAPDGTFGQIPTPLNGFATAATTSGCGHTGPPLPVAYIRRADWGSLRSHVRVAIAVKAAAMACYSVTGDQGQAKALEQKAESQIIQAIGSDAQGEGGQPPEAGSIPNALRAYGRL